jgi:hypothetical protein
MDHSFQCILTDEVTNDQLTHITKNSELQSTGKQYIITLHNSY